MFNRATHSEEAPPSPRDYLPASIQNAILKKGLRHPGTIYPISVGAGLLFVGWLFQWPQVYLIALLSLLLGAAWAIGQIFFFYESLGRRHIQELNNRQRQYEKSVRLSIQAGLNECLEIPGTADFVTQGLDQFKRVQGKLENIQELLGLKLQSGELTFDRFSGAASQVCLGVLDNLKDIVTSLKSISTISPDYIEKRLTAIQHRSQNSRDDQAQRCTLKQRLAMREKQLEKVNQLLTLNEEAMTELETISIGVAEWKTGKRFADLDFESAIKRLQELALHSKDFETTP